MDYDTTEIPAACDRGRNHGPDVLQFWMNVVSSYVGKQRVGTVLDPGCGAGRFSETLTAHLDAGVVGVDPSIKMLDQARSKLRDARVRYEHGSGEAMPLADDSVDLIFTSMCFHHFEDQRLAAARMPPGAA